ALSGGVQRVVTPNAFQLFISLTLLLLLLVGGRNTVVGAVLGGMFLSFFPLLQQHFPGQPNLQYLLTGLAAITIGRNPDGIGGQLAAAAERLRHRLGRPAPALPELAEEANLGIA